MFAQSHDYDPAMRRGITKGIPDAPRFECTQNAAGLEIADELAAHDPRFAKISDYGDGAPDIPPLPIYSHRQGAHVSTSFGSLSDIDARSYDISKQALGRVLTGVTLDAEPRVHVSTGGAAFRHNKAGPPPDSLYQSQTQRIREEDDRSIPRSFEALIAPRAQISVPKGPQGKPSAVESVKDLPKRVAQAKRSFMERVADTVTLQQIDPPIFAVLVAGCVLSRLS